MPKNGSAHGPCPAGFELIPVFTSLPSHIDGHLDDIAPDSLLAALNAFYRALNNRNSEAIRTSRLYRRIDGAWRQVHHHGSFEDPALLAAYR